MKLVALLVLLAAIVACCMAQSANVGNPQPVQQPPNVFQLMLMQQMFDNKWLPFFYMGGGGAARSLFPLLWLGNM